MSVLIIKGTAPCNESEEAILPESGACIEGELFVSDKGACWMPTLHKSEKVGQGGSKGFTYTEKVSYIGLVDFIWNVNKGGASECLFCNPPPEECTDETINLLAGDSKPRHRPFPRQVTIDLYVTRVRSNGCKILRESKWGDSRGAKTVWRQLTGPGLQG